MINAPYSPTCLFLHQYASSEARVSSQSGTLMVYNADITGLIDKAKVEQVDPFTCFLLTIVIACFSLPSAFLLGQCDSVPFPMAYHLYKRCHPV